MIKNFDAEFNIICFVVVFIYVFIQLFFIPFLLLESSETGHEALLHVGEQFTEMFLKHPENVSLILSFLEEYDFKVRWPALKLLTTLLSNRFVFIIINSILISLFP